MDGGDGDLEKLGLAESEAVAETTETAAAEAPKKGGKKPFIIVLVILIALAILGATAYFLLPWGKDDETKKDEQSNAPVREISEYRLKGNSLEDFDLSFLQMETVDENRVYSPLSVKYALGMLMAGTGGETKAQIENVMSAYTPRVYTNSENMSIANALFVNNSFKEMVSESYSAYLARQFGAEMIYDSFASASVLNNWVKEKTLRLIGSLMSDEDMEGLDFVLVNALAIDMEWVNKIQPVGGKTGYKVVYPHTDYSKYVDTLDITGYRKLKFDGEKYESGALEIGAVANRYDIVQTLGWENIRETVRGEYEKWLQEGECAEDWPETEEYLDKYMAELGSGGFGDVSSSSDFYFYTNDDIKVFAKDLKEYNGATLQYVGIMPKKATLDEYIKNVRAAELSAVIGNLKTVSLGNFKEGVLTEIYGYIPVFKFDYNLVLEDGLKKLGITDVFEAGKADLSGLLVPGTAAVISKAVHKATIDFSNDGIKAAVATGLGGLGAAGCGFDYKFELPVEKIDMTFDRPYLFLIRDKASGEVWFIGTVYQPTDYQELEASL